MVIIIHFYKEIESIILLLIIFVILIPYSCYLIKIIIDLFKNNYNNSVYETVKNNIKKYREKLNTISYILALSIMIIFVLKILPHVTGIVFSILIIVFGIIPASGWIKCFKIKSNKEFIDEVRNNNIDNDDRKIIFLRLMNRDKIDLQSLFFSLIGFFVSVYGLFDKITTSDDIFNLFWLIFVTVIVFNLAMYSINSGRISDFKNNVNLNDYSLK